MFFEIEPFGVNDAFLNLQRNGASCVLAFGSSWNGLIRLNCLITPNRATEDPHAVFRIADTGWDGDRFRRRGQAAPILVDSALARELRRRAMITEGERHRLLAPPASAGLRECDAALMLRAALAGCSFAPLYDRKPRLPGDPPPALAGFALRLPADPETHVLEARDGLPVLDERSRAALLREFPRG